MHTYRVTMVAYGMTRERYVEAETVAEARAAAARSTSIGRVTKVELVS